MQFNYVNLNHILKSNKKIRLTYSILIISCLYYCLNTLALTVFGCYFEYQQFQIPFKINI